MPDQSHDDAAATAAAPPEEAAMKLDAQVEDAGPCKKTLAVEIPSEEVNKALRAGMTELGRTAQLPGFRRGHAPLAILEKRFGADLRKDVKSRLIADSYRQVLTTHDVRPIADPDIDFDSFEMTDGEPFKYEMTVEVWPDFEPEGYEGFELEKPSSVADDAEIDAEITALTMRTTKFEEVEDSAAQKDDFLLCDYTITCDDNQIAQAKDVGIRPADDVVGRYAVKGLKKALTGRKTGDSVNLDFKIDKEHFEEELREKAATLALSVKGIRRPQVPEINEEWAKEMGFDSLDELRTVVARNVAAGKERAAEEGLRNQVHEKLVEKCKFDLPEGAVRSRQKEIFKRERTGLQYRGVTEEDLAKISGKLEEASLEKAERDIKLFFILSRIAARENIEATREDLDMRIAELATRYRTTAAKMRRQLEREGMLEEIRLQIQEEKTVAHILSKARIAEAPTPAAEEKKEKAAPVKPKVKKPAAKKKTPKKPAEKSKKSDAPAEKAPKDEKAADGGDK